VSQPISLVYAVMRNAVARMLTSRLPRWTAYAHRPRRNFLSLPSRQYFPDTAGSEKATLQPLTLVRSSQIRAISRTSALRASSGSPTTLRSTDRSSHGR
jgi:hypothetical protein